MPLIFVHGVSNRDDGSGAYPRHVARRDALIRRYILDPLAHKGGELSEIEIVSPYWGKYGANFHWNCASIPAPVGIEDLGDTVGMMEAERIFAQTVEELAGPGSRSIDGDATRIKQAAEQNLERVVETLLASMLEELNLAVEGVEGAETVGRREALLLIAGEEVATDPATRQAVARASTDEEVMALLRAAILERYESLLQEEALAQGEMTRGLGGLSDALAGLRERVDEGLNRLGDAPKRLATLPTLAPLRGTLHREVMIFLGDAMGYLSQRDFPNRETARQEVMATILDAPRHHPDEPLIIMTHSMGGNIAYDILSHYTPELKVDVLITVGGQVGQFEELKLFRGSDLTLGSPNRVKSLQPRVRAWLNIYDPADPFSFLVEPVFEGALDVAYNTGENVLEAHSGYFKRPSFYKLVHDYLARLLV